VRRGRLSGWEWAAVLMLVLVGWGLRVWRPAEVPPGWRDDELINIHALTGEVLAGNPTFYFTGASGHEPLYHTLHALVLALVGMNPLGGHLLSIASGTLTIPLIYVLGRRLFGRPVGLVAATLLASSFWSLMYSRFALRHEMMVPLALAVFYLLRPSDRVRQGQAMAAGFLLAAALYTYTVARLIPLILATFGLYLALVHRDRFRRWRRPLAIALAIAVVLTVPLWVAIAQGRSEAAARGIGADARIAELSVPLRELRTGNLQPLLENARTTLGMFHATGDPEWLYNLPGRPVFGTAGAVLFFTGLVLCLWRWHRPERAFLLIWLLIGISPALVTLPPASLGHTILAQPAAYLLVALPLRQASSLKRQVSNVRRQASGVRRPASPILRLASSALLLATCSLLLAFPFRDLRDYFVTWPELGMVRFLYRADYREAARYLDAHPEIVDVAVGSTLMGPWDRLALADDMRRSDVRARLFNPERALLFPAASVPQVLLTAYPALAPALERYLESPPLWERGELRVHALAANPAWPEGGRAALFANGLELVGIAWSEGEPTPGQEARVWLAWRVARPLDLPPIPVVANPPPPGVYSGPRLSVFTHLLAADGTFVVGDDGLWVDPTTLRFGDRFLQLHRFAVPPDAPPGPYRLEVGLYDPMTGERWALLNGNGQPVGDRFLFLSEVWK